MAVAPRRVRLAEATDGHRCTVGVTTKADAKNVADDGIIIGVLRSSTATDVAKLYTSTASSAATDFAILFSELSPIQRMYELSQASSLTCEW